MTVDNTPQEFARIITCDRCAVMEDKKILYDKTFNLPQPGYIGSDYQKARVLLVGQNPGVSPKRFLAQDTQYASALNRVADKPGSKTLKELEGILNRIIPTWPVTGNYFPLAECGLTLQEIAYFNLVRCRTKDNRPPSSLMVSNCSTNHFVRWLDWLSPSVVVCIGKWAYDRISLLLKERRVLNGFVNRRRSLSLAERDSNESEIVKLVRDSLRR